MSLGSIAEMEASLSSCWSAVVIAVTAIGCSMDWHCSRVRVATLSPCAKYTGCEGARL